MVIFISWTCFPDDDTFHGNVIMLILEKKVIFHHKMCLYCLSQNIFQIFEVTRKCVINYILYNVALCCFFKVQWLLQVN